MRLHTDSLVLHELVGHEWGDALLGGGKRSERDCHRHEDHLVESRWVDSSLG